jgi:hypothetical protein
VRSFVWLSSGLILLGVKGSGIGLGVKGLGFRVQSSGIRV